MRLRAEEQLKKEAAEKAAKLQEKAAKQELRSAMTADQIKELEAKKKKEAEAKTLQQERKMQEFAATQARIAQQQQEKFQKSLAKYEEKGERVKEQMVKKQKGMQ